MYDYEIVNQFQIIGSNETITKFKRSIDSMIVIVSDCPNIPHKYTITVDHPNGCRYTWGKSSSSTYPWIIESITDLFKPSEYSTCVLRLNL